jgi:hypothetical protein
LWLPLSDTIKTAATYTKIGIGFTLVIGGILIFYSILFPNNMVFALGLITIIMAIAAYVTTTMKLNSEDVAGAKGPCLMWGILLIFFGGIIGGVFFLFAHSKIVDYAPAISVKEEYPPLAERETTLGEVAMGAPLAFLYCEEGPERGRTFHLTGRNYKLGRGIKNNIRLSDSTVSRSHAEILWDGVDFYIMDLGSKNGTRLNGQLLIPNEKHRLEEGSELTLGDNTRLRFNRVGIRPSEETPTQPS